MKFFVLCSLLFFGLVSGSIDSFYATLIDQSLVQRGSAFLSYDTETQRVDFNLTNDIGATQALFYIGSLGSGVLDFTLDASGPIRGLVQAFDIAALQSGRYYIEIEGTPSARGEILIRCENGVSLNNMCSCFSAFEGLSCQNDLIGTCSRTPVNEIATEVVAVLNERRISGNHFIFTLDSHTRSNRYFESITVKSPSCSFPGAGFSRSFNASSCADVFVGNFSIPSLVNTCNFVTDNTTNGLLTLSGSIGVAVVDALPSFRGHQLHRITKSVLKIKLNLPTKTNAVTPSIQVVSPISLMSAITSQEYDEANFQGVLLLTTSVQWPYELINPTVSGQEISSFSVSSTFESTDMCPSDSPNSPCTQITKITIGNLSPESNCNFGGWYNLGFQYQVRPGFSGSPVIENPNLSTNITVVSGPSCASIDIDASIAASMEGFDSAEFITSKLAFVANTRLYFRARITADVDIDSIIIESVNLVKEGETILLANETSAIPSFERGNGLLQKGESSFSFIGSFGTEPGALFSPSGDSAQTVTITAEFRVMYTTSFSKKRSIEAEKIQATKSFVLDSSRAREMMSQQGSASVLSSFGIATPLFVGAAVVAAN